MTHQGHIAISDLGKCLCSSSESITFPLISEGSPRERGKIKCSAPIFPFPAGEAAQPPPHTDLRTGPASPSFLCSFPHPDWFPLWGKHLERIKACSALPAFRCAAPCLLYTRNSWAQRWDLQMPHPSFCPGSWQEKVCSQRSYSRGAGRASQVTNPQTPSSVRAQVLESLCQDPLRKPGGDTHPNQGEDETPWGKDSLLLPFIKNKEPWTWKGPWRLWGSVQETG